MNAATNLIQRFHVGTTMPLPLRSSPTNRGSCPGWKLRRLLLVISAGVLFEGVLAHDAAAAGRQDELLKQLQEKLDQRDAIRVVSDDNRMITKKFLDSKDQRQARKSYL